ncbi:MAG: UDP-N-acetylglucosamine 2-epimerase (non-hydrolyzing) [Bacteroidetes bacterium]|jgi:UDP-GlcNAc3NAcA epimerase|nr:UDP-N-acetylglucosamine 2-epimerase (non-hydrolyzing) [Bacteroidota bacterium]
MIHILTVIGARPQIIKAAALSRAIQQKFANSIRETIVHTGQHYDENMSDVFFTELGIPQPNYNLRVGSGSHGKQTAAMISGMEEILLSEKPDAIVLYGDTNSTLAGAVAASKLHIPVVHIEAGLRSFNKSMPEEINRIMCDHVSTLLFSPTAVGFENLKNENLVRDPQPCPASADQPAVYHCGDVMYDNSLHFAEVASQRSDLLQRLGVSSDRFVLATVHRDSNTDVPERLNALFQGLIAVAEQTGLKVILPLHPRTRKIIEATTTLQNAITASGKIEIIPPASFLEMVLLEQHARLVITDSGGVQKEAFFFKKPCVILRPETEWVELVNCGAAILADADTQRITAAATTLLNRQLDFPPYFGDGKAAEFICGEMIKHFAK